MTAPANEDNQYARIFYTYAYLYVGNMCVDTKTANINHLGLDEWA